MIIAITTKGNWDSFLTKMKNYDFYHTYDYHKLTVKKTESFRLLTYTKKEVSIAIPIVVRPINNTVYYDATSVYGYAGPLINGIDDAFINNDFAACLNAYFKKENIISIFSRLNPFINYQEKILKNIGIVDNMGPIVTINLGLTEEQQESQFSKTTKRYLKKTRKYCDIKYSQSESDLDTFMKLYYENMDRVNAEEEYYFSKEYFSNLLKSNSFNTQLIFATLKETDEIISGALFINTHNKVVQYHLSGTANKYLHLTPIRLLIDEIRIKATKNSFETLNLGGGLGSKDDNLFRFKSSFSNEYKMFKTWKYIVNKSAYEELCNTKNISIDKELYKGFFPAYRQ